MEARLKCRSIRESQVAIAIGLRPFPSDAFGKGHMTVTMILMYRSDNPAGIDQIDTAAADVHDQPVVPSGPPDGEARHRRDRAAPEQKIIEADRRPGNPSLGDRGPNLSPPILFEIEFLAKINIDPPSRHDKLGLAFCEYLRHDSKILK
jgi:hypothetical protein